jgi:hypothetical protein
VDVTKQKHESEIFESSNLHNECRTHEESLLDKEAESNEYGGNGHMLVQGELPVLETILSSNEP